MLYNKLYVVPTAETLAYLTTIMGASPIKLNLDSMTLDVTVTQAPFITLPDVVYRARAGTLGIYYDSASASSQLILPLTSMDLQIRYETLEDMDAANAFHKQYHPHITLVQNMPPMARHYRSFINSISNTLSASTSPDLTFTGETVVTTDLQAIPEYDYNNLMNGKEPRSL